jgi:hypothetical protein
MSVNKRDSQAEQRALCAKFNSPFVPILPGARIGIAIQTMHQRPSHGLRHPVHGNMSGWYVWGGEYSSDPNFFQVLHAEHLSNQYPDLLKFFGLGPGFRFLTDGDYIDVWFDESLLAI